MPLRILYLPGVMCLLLGGTNANFSKASVSLFTSGVSPTEQEARSVQAVASCSLEAALSRALGCLVHPIAYLSAYYQLI